MENSKIGSIEIKKAATHNLRDVDVEIPKHQLVAFTGVSGSGKSSLLFHTIYTESQRQLVETFSAFARKRLPKLSRPPVESISNISTPIVIDQKRLGRTLRSTVGTATEINTYLRLIYSRIGTPQIGAGFKFSFNHPEGMCPACKGLGRRITIDSKMLIQGHLSLKDGGIVHPEFKVGGYYWQQAIRSGLFDPDKPISEFTEKEHHDLLYSDAQELKRTLEGHTFTVRFEGIINKLERLYINKGEDEVPDGRKDAYQKYLVYEDCRECGGTRLNTDARNVQLLGKTLPQLCAMELTELDAFLADLQDSSKQYGSLPVPAVQKIRRILGHMIDIGIGYLSLDRAVATLSGGESQRLKMARQLDCDLVDMMYILDEPSIGLHPRDTDKLIQLLYDLRNKGNSVFVVEHDLAVIQAADHILELGPGAGIHGGEILHSGTMDALISKDTPTARMMKGEYDGLSRQRIPRGFYTIENASIHNLKAVSTRIPKGILTCVTGVAGSGKSSLIHHVFCKEHADAVVVDQSPVGKSSRSTPLSYIGAFDEVRKIYAAETGQKAGLFSFNSTGACPKCKGSGNLAVEMNFMDDISIVCDECNGRRYTAEVESYTYKGYSVADVLEMTAEEAMDIFDSPKILKRLKMLQRVGLSYLQLGQPLSQLSGGECQRLKLADELHKKSGLYVMDEPSTGLHGKDIHILMEIIHDLVENGNTVVVIEHNPEIIAQADWIIDMGPEGGRNGGQVLFNGPHVDFFSCKESYTAKYIKQI